MGRRTEMTWEEEWWWCGMKNGGDVKWRTQVTSEGDRR